MAMLNYQRVYDLVGSLVPWSPGTPVLTQVAAAPKT